MRKAEQAVLAEQQKATAEPEGNTTIGTSQKKGSRWVGLPQRAISNDRARQVAQGEMLEGFAGPLGLLGAILGVIPEPTCQGVGAACSISSATLVGGNILQDFIKHGSWTGGAHTPMGGVGKVALFSEKLLHISLALAVGVAAH